MTTQTYTENWGSPCKVHGEWGIRLAEGCRGRAGAIAQVRSRKGSRWFVRLVEFAPNTANEQRWSTESIPRDEQLYCSFGVAPEAPEATQEVTAEIASLEADIAALEALKEQSDPSALYNGFLTAAKHYTTAQLLGAVEQLAFILEARAAEAILAEPEAKPVVEGEWKPPSVPAPSVRLVGNSDGIMEVVEITPEPEPEPQPRMIGGINFDDLDNLPF